VGAESLCNSCIWAHIQRGFRESEEVVLCNYGPNMRQVPFAVAECTDYNDKRIPSRKDMEDIAWILRSKDAGKTAGFVSARELAREEEDALAK